MRILFLHNNFPAQFGRLGQYLSRQGWDVWFGTQRKGAALEGINVCHYDVQSADELKPHPYTVSFTNAAQNGQAVARMALQLKQDGFTPDIVVAHSGWGPGMYIKEVWPDTKFVGYFEWYYAGYGPDVAFLDDEKPTPHAKLRNISRNAAILMDLAICDLAICPTNWQCQQFPEKYQNELVTLHDGIDAEYFSPNNNATFTHKDKTFTQENEILTYVARGMEPYRGFPQFMKALALLQQKRPNLQAIILGQDRVAYGARLPDNDTYLKKALREESLDMDRICLPGLVDYATYKTILQMSSLHAYLTVPFVLSWSMMEAMAVGCPIIASKTPPVTELLKDQENALLVDFHDTDEFVHTAERILDDATIRSEIGSGARQTILENYSADDIFSRKMRLFESLVSSS